MSSILHRRAITATSYLSRPEFGWRRTTQERVGREAEVGNEHVHNIIQSKESAATNRFDTLLIVVARFPSQL